MSASARADVEHVVGRSNSIFVVLDDNNLADGRGDGKVVSGVGHLIAEELEGAAAGLADEEIEFSIAIKIGGKRGSAVAIGVGFG